jgi:hypothetical protein
MLENKIVDSLNGFEPISLIEMDNVKLMNRVDTKFAFSIHELLIFIPDLQSDYRILEIEGTRCPFYESLYFDDDYYSFYKDHHNGRTNRFKVRFRKYVESNLIFLEIKHKLKGRTNKSRIKVEDFQTELQHKHKTFVEGIIAKNRELKPVLWNSFHRLTLVSKTRNERLTLDFNLSFKWEDKKQEFNNLIIAELKQEAVDRTSTFFSLMKKHRIRPYRLSKYCIGSIEINTDKNLKFNRFKKKLLKLKKINAHAA